MFNISDDKSKKTVTVFFCDKGLKRYNKTIIQFVNRLRVHLLEKTSLNFFTLLTLIWEGVDLFTCSKAARKTAEQSVKSVQS